jgi:hypothetical protein
MTVLFGLTDDVACFLQHQFGAVFAFRATDIQAFRYLILRYGMRFIADLTIPTIRDRNKEKVSSGLCSTSKSWPQLPHSTISPFSGIGDRRFIARAGDRYRNRKVRLRLAVWPTTLVLRTDSLGPCHSPRERGIATVLSSRCLPQARECQDFCPAPARCARSLRLRRPHEEHELRSAAISNGIKRQMQF